MRPKLCAVSVDLDGIDLYRGLHGIPLREEGRHLIYDVALPRALDFGREHQLPLTLFAVGSDLQREKTAHILRMATRRGAKVENHSFSHRYDLSRSSALVIERDILKASDVIADVTDRRPLGFRAPGYVLSATLIDALQRSDMCFDASRFPCPSYYAAKLAAMVAIRARGRKTRAIIDDPRHTLGARLPHRIGDLIEIPMAVTRYGRLPVIGTSIVAAGPRGSKLLIRGCIGDAAISLELHGIDFATAADGACDVASHQWDLRMDVDRKRAAIAAVIGVLRGAGYQFCTVADIAATV